MQHRLTIDFSRTDRTTVRLVETHAFAAGDVYNPLVLHNVEGADPATLVVMLKRPVVPDASGGSEGDSVREVTVSQFSQAVQTWTRLTRLDVQGSMSLSTQEMADWYLSEAERLASAAGAAPGSAAGLVSRTAAAALPSFVAEGILEVRDSQRLWCRAPVPVILRQMSSSVSSGADGRDASISVAREDANRRVKVTAVSGGGQRTEAYVYDGRIPNVDSEPDAFTPEDAVDAMWGFRLVTSGGVRAALALKADLAYTEALAARLDADESGADALARSVSSIASSVSALQSALALKADASALSGYQASLTEAQLLAVDSGVTASRVSAYDSAFAALQGKADRSELFGPDQKILDSLLPLLEPTLSGYAVKSSYLPSYVDDVVERSDSGDFPAAGEASKIYVSALTNLAYRWSGTRYVEISPSVALGATSSTAFPGDRGLALEERVAALEGDSDSEVLAALDARPTKAEIDAGWWSEWTCSGAVPQTKWRVVWENDNIGWALYDGEDVAPVSYTAFPRDDQDVCERVVFENGVTAVRHRVAAPVPTKTSELTNDSGFLTQHQDITGKADKSEMSVTSGTGAATIQLKSGTSVTVLTRHQSLAGLLPKYDFNAIPTTATSTEWTFSDNNLTRGRVPNPEFNGGAPDYVSDMSEYGYPSAVAGWVMSVVDPNDPSDVLMACCPGDGTETTFTLTDPDGGTVVATKTVTTTLAVAPYTVATYEPESGEAFTVAVGAGTQGKARDCILVIDCTSLTSSDIAPSITWLSNFHPRTDTATDLAIVEAGKRAVFYISEYAAGEFAVGGWEEPAGGSGT